MNQRKQFLDFVKRLDDLPSLSEDMLAEFTTDLKFAIQEVFGSDSQYLDYLKRIKFRPEAVFVTDRELQRCWYSGAAQVSNLLKVILNDPLIKADSLPEQLFSSDSNRQSIVSSESETEIQLSLQKLKLSMGDDHAVRAEEDGPIKEPLRRDLLVGQEGSSGEAAVSEHDGTGRILLVPGSDQLVNNEVAIFLRSLFTNVSICSSFEDHGPFVDRMNRYADTDFAIVILSPDFLFYPRTQTFESASLMASQGLIFQLGYLVAKLGRQRVIVLFQEHDRFRRPTDYFDLYYVSLNPTGAWKTDILKRMESFGPSMFIAHGKLSAQVRADQASR